MSISPSSEVSLLPQPRVSILDSATLLILKSPIFVSASNDNIGNEVIALENESGTMNTNTRQTITGDNNAQKEAAGEGDGQFHMLERNKTSEAWEDFDEFQEGEIYYSICKHCQKKISQGKTK